MERNFINLEYLAGLVLRPKASVSDNIDGGSAEIASGSTDRLFT